MVMAFRDYNCTCRTRGLIKPVRLGMVVYHGYWSVQTTLFAGVIFAVIVFMRLMYFFFILSKIHVLGIQIGESHSCFSGNQLL